MSSIAPAQLFCFANTVLIDTNPKPGAGYLPEEAQFAKIAHITGIPVLHSVHHLLKQAIPIFHGSRGLTHPCNQFTPAITFNWFTYYPFTASPVQ